MFGRLARRREPWPVLACLVLLASTLAANHADSPSPLSRKFNDGKTAIWLEHPTPKAAAIDHAIRLVRPKDKVAATFYMVPHLTHRVSIYEFPNPFRTANWGVNGEDPPSQDAADTLVLDTTLNGNDDNIYQTLIGPYGPFKIIFNEDGIVVARRKKGF